MTDISALKKCIEKRGMSITFVAEKTGILRETLYNRLKTGDFKISEISALSQVLKLEVFSTILSYNLSLVIQFDIFCHFVNVLFSSS